MVGVTKAIGDIFGKGGIADRSIVANGFPFLDTKEEHTFGVGVDQVMKRDISTIPSSGVLFGQLGMIAISQALANSAEAILKATNFEGYPIVENYENKTLIGFIGRTDLQFAIEKLKRNRQMASDIPCFFFTAEIHSYDDLSSFNERNMGDNMPEDESVDFAQYIHSTPITVHPKMPLENVMEIFQKIGPRVILVGEGGKLMGLITVKDVLKYQKRIEHEETLRSNTNVEATEQKLWEILQRSGILLSTVKDSLTARLKGSFKKSIQRVDNQNNVELGDR